MKLNKLFLGAIAAFASVAMVACSDDAPDVNNGGENGEEGIRYLAVNIVSTPSGDSRVSGEPGNAQYEAGTPEENTVEKVRFYFFTQGGDAKVVKAGQNVNYLDITPTDESTNMPNVEKILKAVLIINTKAGDNLPAKILAVINPEGIDNLDNTRSYNLTNLRNVISDFAAKANADEPIFVMANSVYANSTQTEVYSATSLTVDNFQASEELAQENPVQIYVERNVAKIRAKIDNGLFLNDNIVAAIDSEDNNITISGEQVFIKVNGWNITNTLPNANLSKHIKLDWNNNDLGITWNWPAYFRSYWAAQNTGVGGNNGAKNTQIPYTDFDNLSFTTGNSIYANENAERLGDSGLLPTQIVMSATLCTQDGTPLTICEFAGSRVAATNNDYSHLKNIILDFLRTNGNNYWKQSGGKMVEISADDITFKTQLSINPNATQNTYSVYAQLTEEAATETWYNSADPNTTAVEVSTINTSLVNLGSAMIYSSGNTYYFANIKHFDMVDGIVRNHIYDLTIKSIKGLGTPVYDPNETIIPEIPTTTDSYLAAQVRILSWRIVSQSVNFGE